MRINKLKLKNVRNHIDLELDLEGDITIIIGENGTGKTNILESIYLLSNAKSPRARYDRDIICYEHSYCSIIGNVLSESYEDDLEVQIIKGERSENASSKKVKINKVSKSQKAFNERLNCVLFSPEDINLLTGSPSIRRKYLDTVISQIDYGYKKALSQYTRSLRQRNRILEMIALENRGQEQLEFWTNKLCEYGMILADKRKEYIDHISSEFEKNNTMIKKGLTITYMESELTKERLKEYKNKELGAKRTLIGPHRDDFRIDQLGHDIGEFGSRGQQRSAVLALKLSEIEYINIKSGERPVLLLDDIFSELDDPHKEEVLDLIKKQQTIITSADEPDFETNGIVRIDL